MIIFLSHFFFIAEGDERTADRSAGQRERTHGGFTAAAETAHRDQGNSSTGSSSSHASLSSRQNADDLLVGNR